MNICYHICYSVIGCCGKTALERNKVKINKVLIDQGLFCMMFAFIQQKEMCAHLHVCYVTTLSVLQVVVATEAEEQIISPPYTMTVFEILFSYYYSNFF